MKKWTTFLTDFDCGFTTQAGLKPQRQLFKVQRFISREPKQCTLNKLVSLTCLKLICFSFRYEWFKNGEKLEPNSNTAIQPDGSLTLNNQNNPVEGYYQCKVQNTAGVAISNLTYLQTAGIKTELINCH